MTTRVEKLEKEAAYREKLWSIKLSEYSATFDRIETQLDSLVEWVNEKLITVHEQANERNAFVGAQVGGMVATMAKTQGDVEAKIREINRTSRFLGRTPPRLGNVTEIIDVDEEMEDGEETTDPMAASAEPVAASAAQAPGPQPLGTESFRAPEPMMEGSAAPLSSTRNMVALPAAPTAEPVATLPASAPGQSSSKVCSLIIPCNMDSVLLDGKLWMESFGIEWMQYLCDG